MPYKGGLYKVFVKLVPYVKRQTYQLKYKKKQNLYIKLFLQLKYHEEVIVLVLLPLASTLLVKNVMSLEVQKKYQKSSD